MVGSIGIKLCFKTEAASLFHRYAVLTCNTLEEITCIELNAGQGCINIHFYSAEVTLCGCDFLKASVIAVHTEIVVVAAGKCKLDMTVVNILSDNSFASEIKGSTFNGDISARGDTVFINLSNEIGIN